MRILCLLKLVPDVDQLRYEREWTNQVEDNVRLMINPEDATAVAAALNFKREIPDTYIEVVSMAPLRAMPHLEDLVRHGIDCATLISDQRHAGNDAWATGRALAQYLGTQNFDCIFCGTQAINGGTGQVPALLAEALELPLMVGISTLVELNPQEKQVVVDVDGDAAIIRFAVALPAVLGFQSNPEFKIPYIRYEDQNRDVSSLIKVLENERFEKIEPEQTLNGFLTPLDNLKEDELRAKDPVFLHVDQEGIDKVYHWLEQKGFLLS